MSAASRAVIAAAVVAAAWTSGGVARRWAGLALIALALAPGPGGKSVAELAVDGLRSVATGFAERTELR